MAAEWGESSPLFQSRVLGRFPDEGEQSVYNRSWLDRAVAQWRAWQAGTSALKPDGHRPVFSLDVARGGSDRCALTLRRGPIVQQVTSWHSPDLMATVGTLFAAMDAAGGGPAQYRPVLP